MTQIVEAPLATEPLPRLRAFSAGRRDYDDNRPGPLIGWLIAMPAGVIMWTLLYWAGAALASLGH